MGKPARVLFSMALLMLVMCVGAKDARAQLGDPDYTTLEELATTYGWANAFGWNTTANPCPNVGPNWSGITCNQGRVISITADCGATLLNAALPEILGQLTNLQTLQVKQCGLTGPIPDIFASLPRLSKLTLANNTLSGTIPNSIATLPNAAIVALDDNLLTGAVPDFPDSSSIVIRLAGNFLTSIPGSWTTFNRDLSYNCYPTLPPTCDSQSTLNECSPNREDCPATMFITKVSGDGQWAQINTIYANPLVVSVTDLLGNPLTGVTVTFSGPGIVTTTANSDSNGQASAVVEAGSTAGGNTVTASAGSVPMIAFGLTAGDNAACNTRIAVTNNAASEPGTLQDALADVCPGGTVDLTPIAGQTITLPAGTQSYNFNGRLYIATDVTIQGAGATISGGGATRIFFVQNGNVTLNNLTLTNGAGQGGTSQYGGSGAGLGGAIFENNGNLTLNGVVLSGNQAVGGSTDSSGSITGGGFGGGSSSGDLGGAAGPADGAGGVLDGVGGQGGFGTGGGPGNANLFGTYPGGLGGFGGGGGGWVIIQPQGDILGNSGFGGYGGSQGTSPTSSTSGIGGSGAGFGGAIFVRNGNLNLANVTFTNNSAIGGTGAQGKGASLFMYNGANLNMVPNTVTYSGDVAAAAGFPGQGYSGDPYDNNNTCPGVDTVDICGIVPSNTLTAAVLGGGSIIDTTGLIDCPSVNCTALFQTSATLTAVPAAGSYFTGWSGGCPGTGTCAVSLSGGSALVTATFTAIGTVSTTSGTPQSTMTGTQFASPLVVTVADVNSNPVPGATVVFTTPNSGASATLSAPAVTNAQGQTSVTANANSTPGSYTVTATVAGVAGSANFSLTNIGAPATLAISGGSNQSTAPGTAFATNLQVTATDLAGDPVARVQVIFTANTSPDGAAGMFACSSANVDTEFTNGSGIAQASVLTANGSTGKFTVTAALGSLSQTFTLTNGSSSNVSLSASQFISVLSQPVTLTASLTPSAATGNVTFYDGTNILGVAPVSNGVATLTTSFLPADTNALTALYDGAAPYAPVLSNVQNVLVTPYPSPSLGAPAIYPAAETPMQMVVGDFNGDGIPDLLMFGLNGSSFTVLLGNGDGTFAGSAPQPPTSGECTSAASAITCVLNSPFSAAVGDFNGDGKLDVAFSAPPGLNVLLGNGDGTFQAPLTYVSPMESYLAVADLNGDGMADLVMAGPDPSIQTWLGNGDGTFQPPMATISVGNNVSNVVIGDFNNDGIPDVAVSSFEGSVSVLLGNGDGTLQSGASYQVGYGSSIATGHFYSAANLDLVVANTNQNSLSLLSNAGNGTFGSAVQINLPQGAQAQSVAVGDFNGDRIADLAVGTANGVLVLLGSGGGLFGNPASYTIATGAVFPTVAIADFNRDGHTDVAAISQALTGAAVLLGAIPGESMNSSQGNNQSTGAGTAFATNLQVAITDGNLFPVPNVTVTFTTPSSGASGTFAGGVNTATTNASGIATAAVLTANTTAGGYQVTASVPGLTAVNFSLTNNASAPANIAPTSGSGQSANVNTAFATPLTVTVTDTYGNPVPKATVTFTPPAQSGASVTFAGGINIASTNANGVATSAPIAANGIAGGPYNVAASVNSLTTNFQLTNVPVLTGLGLAPLSGTAGIGTRYTVTATAIGSGNTPLSGVNVIFSVTSGPNTKAAGDGVTNGNGQASLTYTGNGGPGTDVLQASAGGIQSNTVQVSWETPDSLSMTAILPSNESYGTTLPVLESATLTWSGKAKAPTGAIAFSSTASGSFEAKPLCITLGDSMTCGQTFNPSATDVPGTYTFSAGYAGDINYGPSGTTVTNNFSIAPQQPVVTILNVTPPSESYGHGVGVAINASLNWIGGGAAPTAANSQWLTFSSTAAGSFGAVTCSGAKSIQCGVEFTPAATDPAGSYTIAASYAGDNNYKAATSPQRNNFTINADAPLVSLMPTAVTVEKGSTTPVPITASFTGAGSSDAAPDGAVTFRAATGSFSGQSCSANGDVLTCKVNYQPSGKLSVSTYQNYLTATMGASGDYKTASGHANLVVQAK